MVSTINSNSTLGMQAYTTQISKRLKKDDTSAGGNASADTETRTTAGEDRVQLSPMAIGMQSLASQLQDSVGISTGKVTEIQAQVANGTYQISPGKIADRLMSESLLNDLL